MITINNNMYVLDTDNTSYAFAVLGSGQLEHLYYGRKLHANEAVMTEKHTFIPGNTNVYNKIIRLIRWKMCALKCHHWEKAI